MIKPSDPAQVEPTRELSADLRQGAKALREFYLALVREGFSENEAIRIIGEVAAQRGQAVS